MNENKIAIFIPDLRIGGAEKISVNLANELFERGYEVDMVLMRAEGDFLLLLDGGINIVDLKAQRFRSGFIPLISYLRKSKPAAMLACMWPLTIMAILAKIIVRSKMRVVVAEHNTWSRSQSVFSASQRYLIPFSMKTIFRFADSVIAVSNGAAEDFAKYTGLDRKSIVTIYNPVVESIQPEQKSEIELPNNSWSSASFRILNIGIIQKQKNHELLLRAFFILRKSVDAKLLILGEGPLRSNIEQLILELGLQDSVSMPGFIVNTKPMYKHANLFVLSSDWEGLPTVLIEALAAGTPIVSTDCPSGPREILADGYYGILTPVGDAEKLASAMLKSIYSKHNKQTLLNRAMDFTVSKATDKYLDQLLPGWHRTLPEKYS